MNLDLSFLDSWTFVAGVGNYSTREACVMSAAAAAVRVAQGEDMGGATDRLECVDPVVRELCIYRNDAMPDAERKTWALAMIPRIVGTRDGKTQQRAEAVARYAVRVIAADAMDAAGLPAEAQQLRSAETIAECRAVAANATIRAATATTATATTATVLAASRAAAAAAYATVLAASRAAAAYATAAYAAIADGPPRRLRYLDAMIELCLTGEPT